MTDDLKTAFADWLKTRPARIQEFAAQHPMLPGDTVTDHGGETLWFMGYSQWADRGCGTIGLVVSPVDPTENYDRAMKTRQLICPEHFA